MAAASSGAASSATDAIVGIDADASGTASAAAATGGASKSPAILGEATEDILGHIRALKEQQLELNNARNIVAKQLKNQSKRMARIRKKARLLSDSDLLALLNVRIDNTNRREGGLIGMFP